MAQNKALNEDRNYLAVMIGVSLLVSLFVMGVGSVLAGSGNATLAVVGTALTVLSWLWVAGTVGLSLLAQARMRQLYGRVAPVRVLATK